MNQSLTDYYRCPEELVRIAGTDELSPQSGFFRFEGVTAFGRCAGRVSSKPELASEIACQSSALPFDLDEIVDNLRLERYVDVSTGTSTRFSDAAWINRAYYYVRPLLPVRVRKYLQKIHLNDWKRITFPSWPIDSSVDTLMQTSLRTLLSTRPESVIPFIWFWPDSFPACGLVTHDVEHAAGSRFVLDLLELDDSFGIKSSFQIVPEERYDSSLTFIRQIQDRGFEVNVHDLNHDGYLFRDRDLFLQRAKKINDYASSFGSEGFRSGSMYRNAKWLSELEFVYDMSVPNAAHLEPQRGGCCTVMPYKIGDLVELPLTMTQDYSLFHILGDYSMQLWEKEIEYTLSKNGLVNFIVHPDYVIDKKPLGVYRALLKHLSTLREQQKLWMPLPREAARWWKDRSRMRLEHVNGTWIAAGDGSERATVAYARLEGGRLTYEVQGKRIPVEMEPACVVRS